MKATKKMQRKHPSGKFKIQNKLNKTKIKNYDLYNVEFPKLL